MEAVQLLSEVTTWQKILDMQDDVFRGIMPGSKIGLMVKEQFGSEGSRMMVWEIQPGSVQVQDDVFRGFRNSGVDLLFVAEEDALLELYQEQTQEAFSIFSNMIREGRILFYYLVTHDEIVANGYEEFLEKVGVPFMGGCH